MSNLFRGSNAMRGRLSLLAICALALGLDLGCHSRESSSADEKSIHMAVTNAPADAAVLDAYDGSFGDGGNGGGNGSGGTQNGIDAAMAWDDPGHLADPIFVSASEETRQSGRELTSSWIRRSYAVAVVRCTGAQSRVTAGPPFAATTYTFDLVRSLKGDPPASTDEMGGSFADHDVTSSETPVIRTGETYVAFFIYSNRGPLLLEAPPLQSDSSILVLSDRIGLDELQTMITAAREPQ